MFYDLWLNEKHIYHLFKIVLFNASKNLKTVMHVEYFIDVMD